MNGAEPQESRAPMTDGEYDYLSTWQERRRAAIPVVAVALVFFAVATPGLLSLQSWLTGAPLSMFALVATMVVLIPVLAFVMGYVVFSIRATAKALQQDLSGREVLVISGAVTSKRKVQNRGIKHKVEMGSRSFNVSALGIFDAIRVGTPLELRVGPSTGHVLSGRLHGGQWVPADFLHREPGERPGSPAAGPSIRS